MKIKKHLPLLLSMAAALLVLVYVIAVPIGVADAGGQFKTVEKLGLSYIDQQTPDYFSTQYGVAGNAKVSDTHSLLLSLVTGSKSIFDTRTSAAVLGVLFLLGLLLAVKSGARDDRYDWALAILCVCVFADFAYLSYFTTLYYESTVLVTFLLAVSLLLLCHKVQSVSVWLIVLSATASAAFALCGSIQACVGVILGVLIALLFKKSGCGVCKAVSVVCGLLVAVLSLTFALTYTPVDYQKNIFHAVFLGTAEHESVAALGLDPKLDALKGQFYSDAFVKDYNLNEEFYNKISYGKITAFYLTHPGAFIAEADGAVKNAFSPRAAYLGNFTEQSGKAGEQANAFALYSTLKGTFVPNTFVFVLVFFALYIGLLIYLYVHEKEKRPLLEVIIGLSVSALLCLKLPIIFSGGFEIGRALYMFNILFDTMVVFAVVAGGRYMAQRRKILKDKYGANQ